MQKAYVRHEYPTAGKTDVHFRKRIGFDNAFMSRIFRMQNLKPAEVIRDLCICTLINQMFCKILQIHGTSPVKITPPWRWSNCKCMFCCYLFHGIFLGDGSTLAHRRIQNSLADTQAFRSYLKKLVGINEVKSLL